MERRQHQRAFPGRQHNLSLKENVSKVNVLRSELIAHNIRSGAAPLRADNSVFLSHALFLNRSFLFPIYAQPNLIDRSLIYCGVEGLAHGVDSLSQFLAYLCNFFCWWKRLK